ncbi:MAG: hypothetical protein KAV83_00055 [Desulfobacterales bacterium]|nr:hypothetical protein [Desulfobacterales bacterium]
MVDVEKIAGSFRSAIQDLLVPELKAINVELKHHGEEFIRIDKRFETVDKRLEALHQEMNKRFEVVDRRFEALHQEMNKRFEAVDRRFEALHQEMNKRFETIDRRFDLFAESMRRLETTQEKILIKLDLKEQLTETAAKTDQLEKRMNDVWSMLKTMRTAEASH